MPTRTSTRICWATAGTPTGRPNRAAFADYVDHERRLRREMNLSARTQSAREVRASIAAGTTHMRTHVDIDTDAGLTHFEGVLATP